jgi:hypothetical protein
MDNNSWLLLDHQAAQYQLPPDLRQRDAFAARDCGWVEQMRPFIRQYSRPGDLVFDPFCGFGTSLVAAHVEGRRGIGFEIEPSRAALARERLARMGATDQQVRQTSPVSAAGLGAGETASLLVTSLPYFGCSWADKGGDEQLYASRTYEQFLGLLWRSFKSIDALLSPGAFLIVMAENLKIGRHFAPLAWDAARLLSDRFFFHEERLIVYDRPSAELPPCATGTNRAHEYALIAQKVPHPIDCRETLQVLQQLAEVSAQWVVYGSFARWIRSSGESAPPADADLLVPNDPAWLIRMCDYLEEIGFLITRWGKPLHRSAIVAAMPGACYLRAERLTADGHLCLIDLCFQDERLDFETEFRNAESIGGLRVVASDSSTNT